VVLGGALAGCGIGEFEDRTAVVEVDRSTRTFEVDSCGLDGRTVFLVARDDDGTILQAVVGLEDDSDDGIVASTGVTIDADPDRLDTRSAAFGPEAWARRGETGAPPGRIDSARLRGSRIQFDGQLVALDAFDDPVPGAELQPFSVDARCDEDG
jgi:hypothetical protein